MDAASCCLLSSSRLAAMAVPMATFTAFSVSTTAFLWRALSSSEASMDRQDARMVTFSASSSVADTLASSCGMMTSSFWASSSSFFLRPTVSLTLRLASLCASVMEVSSRALLASPRMRSVIIRTLACRSVSPGQRAPSPRSSDLTSDLTGMRLGPGLAFAAGAKDGAGRLGIGRLGGGGGSGGSWSSPKTSSSSWSAPKTSSSRSPSSPASSSSWVFQTMVVPLRSPQEQKRKIATVE
mmetsp:Transcript_3971/g.10746  ORF Transcript_3971/g.10746 Transcript_3971/m.10746 type:complete len:239 (-) Transcript_3971:16-732(-)